MKNTNANKNAARPLKKKKAQIKVKAAPKKKHKPVIQTQAVKKKSVKKMEEKKKPVLEPREKTAVFSDALFPELMIGGKKASRRQVNDLINSRIRNLADVDSDKPVQSSTDRSRETMVSARLLHVALINARMIGADLSRARLIGANLSGADLSGAELVGANLSNANLSNTNLTSAGLNFAYLLGTDLRGANLSGAHLNDTVLTGAKYDQATVWPEGFDPVAAGAIMVS